MSEQVQNPVQPVQVVTSNLEPIVNQEASRPAPPSSSKGHGKMLVVLGVLGVLIIAVLVGVYFYTKNMSQNQLGISGQSAQNNSNSSRESVATVTKATPTPTPITSVSSSGDLTKLLNELDSMDTSSMQSDYDNAVSESGNL